MSEPDRETDEEPTTRDVATAGADPPEAEDLDAVVESLVEDAVPADSVLLVRMALAADRGPSFADNLVAALDDQVTVVGSSVLSPAGDGLPQLNVLVETDRDPAPIASSLADVADVEGVVVADVVVPARAPRPEEEGPAEESSGAEPGGLPAADRPSEADEGGRPDTERGAAPEEAASDEEGDAERAQLSIYRLGDNLVVTDDVGAFLERLYAELDDDLLRRAVTAALEPVREDLEATAARVEAIEGRVDAVEDDLENRLGAVEGDLEEALATAETALAANRELEAEVGTELDAVGAELEEVADAVEGTVDEAELAELREYVEREVPTTGKIKQVFSPAARRVDGEGRHATMAAAVEEIDEELRRTYALREAGFLGRLRWLVTGTLPPVPGESGESDEEPS